MWLWLPGFSPADLGREGKARHLKPASNSLRGDTILCSNLTSRQGVLLQQEQDTLPLCSRQFVVVMLFPSRFPAFAYRVESVIKGCAFPEMALVAARRKITAVAHAHAGQGPTPMRKVPRHNMRPCINLCLRDIHSSVAIFSGQSPLPRPALIRHANLDLCPELLFKRSWKSLLANDFRATATRSNTVFCFHGSMCKQRLQTVSHRGHSRKPT